MLAETLHMTVEDMRDTVSNREYHQWRAFFVYCASVQEQEATKASTQAEVKRSGR